MEDYDGEKEVKMCDFCGSQGVEIREYSRSSFNEPKKIDEFCWLCASTMAGNAHQYPGQYRESAEIMRTICFVGNEIIKAIKEGKNNAT